MSMSICAWVFFIYFCDIRQLIIDIQLIRTHRIVQRYRWEDWIVWQTMVVYESDRQRRGSWCGLWPWFCFDFCICCWEHLQKDSGVTRYERYIYVNIERFISSYICLCIFTLSLSKNLSSDCANCAQVFYAYWPTVYNQQSNNAIKTHIDHNRHCAQTDNFLAYHARCARTLRQFVLYHLFWKHIQWWWNDLSVRTHVIILFSLDTHSLAHTHCCLCTLNESIKNQNITKSSSTFQTK